MPFATPGAADAHPDDSPLSLPEPRASGDGASGTRGDLPSVRASGTPAACLADDVAVDRHHVTRIDIEPSERYPARHPTHGWQVRARRSGRRESKFFADARHASREAALDAALAYRDRLLAELPDADAAPRRAWSNTGVVGLSVREKEEGRRPKLYVQLNWIDAAGTRRAASYSVDKWGLRRALWNGCLRLYRERAAAGAPVEEPHVMFARAQEPFGDLLRAELAAERAREAAAPAGTRAVPADAPAAETPRAEAPRAEASRAVTAEAGIEREAQTLRRLEDVLFG